MGCGVATTIMDFASGRLLGRCGSKTGPPAVYIDAVCEQVLVMQSPDLRSELFQVLG